MKNLKVGKSKIQGKGLFTTQPFTKGSFIGLAHEDDQPSTMIGKYHNHSESPNAMSVKVGGKRYLVAKRPLKNNEEITTDYRLQPELEQPDQFKRGGIAKLPKMPKPSKKGVLSKNYSRSIEATNKFFTENRLFEKPKSRKRKVFDPNANYQEGGQPRPVQGMAKPLAPLAIRQEQVKALKNSPKVADQKKYKAVQDEVKAKATIQKASEQLDELQKDALPQYEQPLDMMDYAWTGAVAAPVALPALGELAAVQIPYMGTSLGTLANTAGAIHGATQVPDRIQDWKDVSAGKKDWRDATLNSVLTGSEFLGAKSAYDAIASNVKNAYNTFSDVARGSNVSNLYSEGANTARSLQEAGLLGKDVDPKLFGQFPGLGETATKAALKKFNTSYRAVTPQLEGASVNELMNMAKSGVTNFDDPVQVAQYMSTHVPMEAYGYRANALQPGAGQDVLYTGKYPNIETASNKLKDYGTHITEVRPEMDFSSGNTADWFKKYHTDRPFGIDDAGEAVQKFKKEGPSYTGYQSGTIAGKRSSEYLPYMGNRGEKVLQPIRTIELNPRKKEGGTIEDISLPQAEYGMPMGAGMSQNYQGRKKFIYDDGGYIETELTDDEIEEYRRGGWIVEDIY